MRVIVVTPPEPVLTWEEADAHLQLDGDTSKQAYVESLIAAATGHIDGPDGWLGRAIGPQTIEARFDAFEGACFEPLRLPCPPLIEIESVKYLDRDGNEQTVGPEVYEVIGRDVVAVQGAVWPPPLYRREAVRITYTAGYDGEPGRVMPAAIKAAIKLMVGDLYANRESVVVDGRAPIAIAMPTTVERLLGPFQVFD